MKKILLLVVIVGIVYVIARILLFVASNFLGLQPSLGPQPSDIAPKSTSSNQTRTKNSGQHTTGLPLMIPEGFTLAIFARDLGGPRVIALDPNGVVVVSIPSQGRVVALPDTNGDGQSDETVEVADKLNRPHGLAFHEGNLIIAETNQVAVWEYDQESFQATHKKKVVDLPGGGNHFTRTIGLGPDGKLYITIGSSCNVCKEQDSRRAKMLVADIDGGNLKDFATGLRNTVFFRWHPTTGMLWATDMGRDLLGDDVPPDEINILQKGSNYGWPYCYGKNIHDKHFDASQKAASVCRSSQASYIDIPAHSAPLGLSFIPPSSVWPKEYWYNLLVSYHGSWNRSVLIGYKVVRYKLDQQGVYLGEEDFLSGWLTANGVLGRPVDILIDPNGIMYLSDDHSGMVYRITVSS